MKNQRTLLIEQAARDHADEGTEWRERMDKWLDRRGPNLGQWFAGTFIPFTLKAKDHEQWKGE